MFDKFFSEALGTFIFLSVIITSVSATGASNNSIAWVKIGLSLAVTILLVGYISGGHLNPAVSFMFYLNDDINIETLLVYILGQLVGATLAFAYFSYIKKYYPSVI